MGRTNAFLLCFGYFFLDEFDNLTLSRSGMKLVSCNDTTISEQNEFISV